MVRVTYDTKPLYRRFAVEWLVLLLALMIFAGILGWLWHTDRQALAKREAARLHTQATVIERNAIRQLQAADHVLQDFINRLEGWTRQPEGMARAGQYLEVLSNAMPEISTLFFLDQDGIGRAFSKNAADYLGQDFSKRPYFQPLKESSRGDFLYLSAPFLTLRDSYAMNIIRAVVGPDGKFNGIVAAGLEPNQYRVLLSSVLYAPDMWVSIAHGSGVQFMMEPDRPGQAGRRLNVPGSLLEAHKNSGQVETLHQGVALGTGEERFMLIRTVEAPDLKLNTPLFIGVSRGLDDVFLSSDILRRSFTVILIGALMTSGGALFLNQLWRLRAGRSAWQALQDIREKDDILNRFFLLNLDLFAVIDLQGHFKQVNEAWVATLGYELDDLVGKGVRDFVHPEDQKIIERKQKKLLSGQPTFGFIMRVRHADGKFLEVQWRVLMSENQYFLSGRDVTAEERFKREIQQLNTRLESQKAMLQDMAFHDGLTGVFNRRRFDEALTTEWRACLRDELPLAVLLLDIDHFKRFNDTYGHLQGDDCLQKVAQEFQARCRRPRDIVARYGGEEFAAILPETDIDGALNKAKEIVQAIAKLQIQHSTSPVATVVTVSIGVATLVPSKSMEPEVLVAQADAALYSAKLMGRNRAIASTETCNSLS